MLRSSFFFAALAAVSLASAQTRPHNFDLLDVKWSVALDEPNSSLTGDVTNTLRADKGAKSIQFDFGSLNVDGVTVDGSEATFAHTDRLLTVTLPKAADGTRPNAIRIKYHGKPQSGAYFVPGSRAYPAHTPVVYTQGEMVDNRFWLPTYDYPDDKATSEGTIDVPAGWFALSNGKLMDQATSGGRTKFHWKMDKPHATYLISFSAGPFDEGKEEWDGIPVNFYVPKGLHDQGEAAFGGTADIVRFYSQLTGFRYPYAKYTQSAVPDFMYGGMENITCTTQTIGALHSKSSGMLRDTLGLVAHELAHQWFGDTVTCSGWSDAWINEGWATFLPLFYYREKRGVEAFDIGRYDTFGGGLGAHQAKPDRAVVFKGYKDAIEMFDGFIYPGGASRMLMLMHQVGEEKFWAATRAYLEERKYTSFDTPAFFDTWSKNLGMDLKPFMQQWFYTAGAPNLTVTREGSNLVVTQAKPYFDLDLPVWTLKDGTWTKKSMKVTGERSTLDLGSDSSQPVLADPECWLMANISDKVGMSIEERIALFNAAPNAGERARMIDTMLGDLSAQQALDLAKTIKSQAILARYMGHLQDGSQAYLLELTHSSNEQTAATAVQRLSQLPSNDAVVTRLREMTEEGTNGALQQGAFQALLTLTNDAALADKAWTMEGEGDGYRQMALGWWRSQNPDMAREKALEAIAKGLPEPTRQQAIGMLGSLKDKVGEKRVYSALVSVLKETSFGARTAAINALAEYGDKAAIPFLEPFEHHELVFFRQSAGGALARLRGK